MSEQEQGPTLITQPAEGVPPVVDTPAALAETIDALGRGTGPVGVDTERAHGFRYTSKAYLVQLRRPGAGTFLVDPVAFEDENPVADLSELGASISGAEWIIHAATQDLPSLTEVGLVPRTLFDTELAGRLLGWPRVSLGVLVAEQLGVSLLKEHSASDWSRRPLPDEWLAYAALDVELLGELRDRIAEELSAAGKQEWAEQEFSHLVAHAQDAPAKREDPWRRTSGLHAVRSPLGLAYVRELWNARDELAASLDAAPGRLLSDRAISELASQVQPRGGVARLGRGELRGVPGFRWRMARRYEDVWLAALERVAEMPNAELPTARIQTDGPGAPRTWANKYPEAYARWQRIRPAIVELSEKWLVPAENLIAPDAVRKLCFEPPAAADLDEFLAHLDVRPWQRELVVGVIAPLL